MADKNENTEYTVFRSVLYHCLMIVLLPIITFFVTKGVFDGVLGLSNSSGNIYSAIFAVIALHIALGSFIYRAYFDNPQKIQDKAD